MAKYAIVIVYVSAMFAITMFYLKVSYDRFIAVCQWLSLKIMINFLLSWTIRFFARDFYRVIVVEDGAAQVNYNE